MFAHLSSLRRPSQLPDSLPDASSAVRRRFSLHQFPVRIAPFRRPSVALSLRRVPRPLAFLRLATLFQTSVGLTRCAGAPCLPLDARASYLTRFRMRRLPSEDGFLFTSSRFGLLRSGVPERGAFLAVHTSPPGFSPSCDFDPPRSRIVTLLPPLSPFGPVPALLPFPFLGRS